MSNKVLFVISVIMVFVMALSCIGFTIYQNQVAGLQEEYQTLKERNDDAIDAPSEINSLYNQRDTLKEEYERLLSTKDIRGKAESYLKNRYSFNGSQKDNKNNIISSVSKLITESHKTNLESELSKSIGNGNVSDNFRHTCEIRSVFVSDIYEYKSKNGVKSNSKVYMINVYARIYLNETYEAYSVITFTRDKTTWKIANESLAATRFEEFE